MKIVRLRAFAVKYPLSTGKYRMSQGRLLESLESTIVELTAENGRTGFGEACTLAGSYIEGFGGLGLEIDADALPSPVFDLRNAS